jgi:phosphohistidine swiveling domain-containing protein
MTNDDPASVDDPMHSQARNPATRWTIANVGEALVGVHPPLTVSFAMDGAEISGLMLWYDNGVLASEEVRLDPDPDHRMTAAFYGRFCLNLTKTEDIVTRLPGVDAARLEESLTGESRGTAQPADGTTAKPHISIRDLPAYGRLLAVGALATPRLGRRLRALKPWWRQAVRTRHDYAEAQRLLRESYDRYVDVLRFGLHASMLAPRVFGSVGAVAEAKGLAGLETQLFTGLGMPEDEVAEDLWEVSRGRLTAGAVVERHGYQAPRQFDFIADSWRTRPQTIDPMVARLENLPETQSPAAKHALQVATRKRAEASLLAAAKPLERLRIRVQLTLAAHFLRQREAQKIGCLMALDTARAATRDLAGHLTARGVLAEPGDIAYLRLDEVCAPELPADLSELITRRRARFEEYLALDLPESWVGPPVPITRRSPADDADGDVLTGFPVAPGVVEGRAVVVVDPDDVDAVDAGAVVVCRSTDPSWTPIMLVAAAMVIDVGGPISHGAIVARELGIPCVINTKAGTRRIRTGDLIRVDGTVGQVTVLERAPSIA